MNTLKKCVIISLTIFSIGSATWYYPVNVLEIQTIGAQVIFKTTGGFPANRWWQFDASTANGEVMLSILLTSRANNIPIRFDGGTYSGWGDTYFANNVQLEP